jgi:hypothetical protein
VLRKSYSKPDENFDNQNLAQASDMKKEQDQKTSIVTGISDQSNEETQETQSQVAGRMT